MSRSESRPRSRALALILVIASVMASGAACKENGNDYLDEGLRLLGEAERGDCKPDWDVARSQNTIDATLVARCLDKTKIALEQLHKARELGVENREIDNLIAKTEDEVSKLESMLKIVGRLQREVVID